MILSNDMDCRDMPQPIDAFDKEYREVCFYAWYSAGCPVSIKSAVPEDVKGRKPSNTTLSKWARDEGWKQRADAMDAQLSVTIDTEIIERKKQDYLELSQTGRELIKGATEYLKAEGFDSASAAVRAIGLGAEMVSKYSRAAEMIDSITGKTDKQIEKEIYRLLGKNTLVVDDGVVEDSVIELEETDSEDDSSDEDNNS